MTITFTENVSTLSHGGFSQGKTYKIDDEAMAGQLIDAGFAVEGNPNNNEVIDPAFTPAVTDPDSPAHDQKPSEPADEDTVDDEDDEDDDPQAWSLDVGEVTLTLDDVAGKTDDELLAIDGVGPKRLVEIRDALKAAGSE